MGGGVGLQSLLQAQQGVCWVLRLAEAPSPLSTREPKPGSIVLWRNDCPFSFPNPSGIVSLGFRKEGGEKKKKKKETWVEGRNWERERQDLCGAGWGGRGQSKAKMDEKHSQDLI